MANTKQYTKQELMQLAYNTAIKYGVAPEIVMGIIDRETGGSWNPGSKNYSKIERSQGLMQINIDAHPDYKGGYDPVQNIDYGVRFLQRLLRMYGGDYTKAVAAYNGSGSKAREYSKDVLTNRATKFDKNTMNTLAKNSGVSPTSSQGLLAKMQGGTTGAAANIDSGYQQLPDINQTMGIQTNPNQMYNTMTDLQTGKDNVYDAYGTFGNKPMPTSAQELLDKRYGAGVQDYKNAYDAQIANLDKAYEDIQNVRATNDQELLAKFKAMREIAAKDPRLQNQGYYLDPKDVERQIFSQRVANLAGLQYPNAKFTPRDYEAEALLRYRNNIANQYGVPYQEYMDSRLQNMNTNLGISQGEIQYLANRAAAGDTLAQQRLQSLQAAGTAYSQGLANAGKLDADNAKEAIKLILSGDNELRKEGMKALVKLYPDMQDRVKEILKTEIEQQGGIVEQGIQSATSENTAQTNANAQRDVATIQTETGREKLPYEKDKLQSQTNLNNATAYYNLLISQGMTHDQALAKIYGDTQNNTPTSTPTQTNTQMQPNLVRDSEGNAINPVSTQGVPQIQQPNNQGSNIWNNVVGIGANAMKYGIPGGIGAGIYAYDTYKALKDQAQQRGWIGGNN